MTYANLRDFGPAQGIPPHAESNRWTRLSLRAIAVLAVIGLAALGSRSDLQGSDLPADHAAGQPETASDPVFDGRGKWAGYGR